MNRFFTWLETKKGFYIAIATISFLSAILRFIRITFPSSRVFDEVYSPAFAWKLLHHQSFFDIHPLLTQLPHSVGLLLFGDTPLGWRFSAWIWGFVFCWATAFTAYLLTNRRLAGVFGALLVSLDTAYFVYGRTGLPDMFLLTQVAIATSLFLASIRLKSRTLATLSALLAGIFLGNVISTKWLGLAIMGSIWSWLIIYLILARVKKTGRRQKTEILLPNIHPLFYVVCFAFLPALTYYGWLLLAVNFFPPENVIGMTLWQKIVWWHQSVWNYNVTLTATHPYSSKWWMWPFVIHPVLFFWEQSDGGRRVINATGNVFLWWSGIVALLGAMLVLLNRFIFFTINLTRSVIARSRATKQSPVKSDEIASATSKVASQRRISPILVWLIISSLCFWLPWIKIGRIAFNYHYFETFFFEVLLMSLILTFLADKPKYRPFVIGFFIAIFISFALLYPEASGMFVSNKIPFVPFFFPY